MARVGYGSWRLFLLYSDDVAIVSWESVVFTECLVMTPVNEYTPVFNETGRWFVSSQR
jgi:hypothetical protein